MILVNFAIRIIIMKICTFFGHSDAPPDIRGILKETITELIEQHQVHEFLVGNHGKFDSMVKSVLKELQGIHPQVHYTVVLAYFPKEKILGENTLLPEGIELCHPKAAIDYRNKWMLDRSEYVISYVNRSFGGAQKFYRKAVRQNKKVVNIAYNR